MYIYDRNDVTRGATARGRRTRRSNVAMKRGVAYRTDAAPPAAGATGGAGTTRLAPAAEAAIGGMLDVRLEAFVRDSLPDLLRKHPQVLLSAVGGDAETFRAALKEAGWSETERSINPSHVANAYREQLALGGLDNGFGSHLRNRCVAVRMEEPNGRKRTTYIHTESAIADAHAWLRAVVLNRNSNGIDPQTGHNALEIRARLERHVRAPADNAATGADGVAGSFGSSVPTLIAAEIWQLISETFPLPNLVQKYVSAQPLQLPREEDDVSLYTGGNLTTLTGTKATIDSVKLSVNRVGAITFVDPQLAMASSVGVVRYVISRLARAYARFLQNCIISGDGNGKPKGWLAQPTANVDHRLNIKVGTYVDTDQTTRRYGIRRALYQVPQYHRGENPSQSTFRWVGNGDLAVVLESHNDMDKEPWSDEMQSYLRRRYEETTQIATAEGADPGDPGTTTMLGADMNAYALVESPTGMEIAQTTEGAGAFEAHGIAVKLVAHIDGDVILPNAGVRVDDIPIPA